MTEQPERDQSDPAFYLPQTDGDYLVEIQTFDKDNKAVWHKSGGHLVASRSNSHPLIGVLGNDALFGLIGRFILHWSCFERSQIMLTHGCMALTGDQAQRWAMRPYEKRKDLLVDQWEKVFNGHNEPISLLKSVLRNTGPAKAIRDHISHDEIESEYNPDRNPKVCLRFFNYESKQKSARYTESDIRKAIIEVSEATGMLLWLNSPESLSALPFPPPCILILRSLQNAGSKNPPRRPTR